MAGPDLVSQNVTPVGYMDVLVGLSSTYIDNTDPALTHNANSLGAMANTEIIGEVNVHQLMAGSPQKVAEIIPTGETFGANVSFFERSLKNLAFARGEDPTNWGGGTDGSGEVPIGVITAPTNIRCELVGLYPDASKMVVIMPRAQVTPNSTLGSNADTPAEVAVTVNALPADSNAPGSVGNAVWDSKPLGSIRIKLDT